jgi:uncharacterized protein (DUF2249 family)
LPWKCLPARDESDLSNHDPRSSGGISSLHTDQPALLSDHAPRPHRQRRQRRQRIRGKTPLDAVELAFPGRLDPTRETTNTTTGYTVTWQSPDDADDIWSIGLLRMAESRDTLRDQDRLCGCGRMPSPHATG